MAKYGHMMSPTMVYALASAVPADLLPITKKVEVDGAEVCYKVVDGGNGEEGSDIELETALAEGWHRTHAEALGSDALVGEISGTGDTDPPTREELEAKATELGISFGATIKDETLLKRIEEKLAEAGE